MSPTDLNRFGFEGNLKVELKLNLAMSGYSCRTFTELLSEVAFANTFGHCWTLRSLPLKHDREPSSRSIVVPLQLSGHPARCLTCRELQRALECSGRKNNGPTVPYHLRCSKMLGSSWDQFSFSTSFKNDSK